MNIEYVDQDGFVCDEEGLRKGDEPTYYSVNSQNENFIFKSNMKFVDKFPLCFRILDVILREFLILEVKNITLTEKNKGGDYQSSAFTLETSIFTEKRSILQDYIDDLQAKPFTMKHAPFYLISSRDDFVKSIEFVNSENHSKFNKVVKKDIWLVDFLKREDLDNIYFVQYKPFKLKKCKSILDLNIIEQTQYQSILTKYIEIDCNKNINTPKNVVDSELYYLEQRYLAFLLGILEKYFIIHFIE